MADLLLELHSEEIPARMQEAALTQLQSRITTMLDEIRLSYGTVQGYVTPRRLAVWVQDVPQFQPDQTIERKGPKVSAPDKAIEGFCKSVGVVSRDALEVRRMGKDDVYMAVMHQSGKASKDVLQQSIASLMADFHWPKSMRWGNYDGAWVRPLRSILCLLDDSVIPVAWGHITAGNITYGHRFMAPDKIEINHPSDYEAKLKEAYVIADASKRQAMIAGQLEEIGKTHNMGVKQDIGLFKEVTGLVEYPVALFGSFDAEYMQLPQEVLVLEMRHHQKYFAVLDSQGQVAPHFVTVSNIQAQDGGRHIVEGNERVLRARLDDGLFFWAQDRKTSLDVWANALEGMVFHHALGTMKDKVERIKTLAAYLAVFVPHATITHVSRAAELAKADLTTGMVGEFPELQGTMGRYYALAAGEDEAVADAIRDHYKPVGQSDDLPASGVGTAVALADKLDTLAGLFAAGELPTGSKDPFALRRAALGVIRMIRTHDLRIPLSLGLGAALAPFKQAFDTEAAYALLHQFMMDRLTVMLREEGMAHDVVAAVCAVHSNDITDTVRVVNVLADFLNMPRGAALVAGYKRASNIVRKEESKEGRIFTGDYVVSLIEQPEEKALAAELVRVSGCMTKDRKNESYEEAFVHLAELSTPLDAFFDQVMVNSDNAEVRVNRLNMLAAMRAIVDGMADLSHIEG